MQVAHNCNPSYSGGKDQEDPSSKSVLGKALFGKKKKKSHNKRAGRMAQAVRVQKYKALN
jgi:hypothetical protein